MRKRLNKHLLRKKSLYSLDLIPIFKGYSQFPNEWLDEVTSQIDNVAELKIVLYIYRHTWGFQEKKNSPDDPAKHDEIKHITTDEFMHGRKKADGTRMDRGTELSNRSVIDGLRNSVAHGYIMETINDRDKGRVVKSYALNILKSNENSCEESSQAPMKNAHRGMKPSHSNYEETSHRTEKEPRERNQKNEREKESAIAPSLRSHSSIHSSFSLSEECLDKVKAFSELYEDENVTQHQEEAERLYQQSGKTENEFYNAIMDARALVIGKKRSMGEFFKHLRKLVS